jgi:hypothetical protein
MGIFGNDDEQNARLDALENHVRNLSDGVQQNLLDLVELRVIMIAMRAKIGQKLSNDDVDPTIVALNEQLGAARIDIDKAAEAATESWTAMHAGAAESLRILRASAAEATARVDAKPNASMTLPNGSTA